MGRSCHGRYPALTDGCAHLTSASRRCPPAGVCSGRAPTPVAAVDAIPAEQSGERLAEATVTAVVGDVDGDGIRELIRLGPLADDETHIGVEVISADEEGVLTRHGMAPFRRLAGVEEQTEGQAVPDERGMVAARIDEPARLLVWRVPWRRSACWSPRSERSTIHAPAA